jgi:hypothetical protein
VLHTTWLSDTDDDEGWVALGIPPDEATALSEQVLAEQRARLARAA